MAVETPIRATERFDVGELAEDQADGLSERLATWSVTFVASLAASLSLLGAAWALGLLG
jgi:hypothetical protein